MTASQCARLIDISAVRTHHSLHDIAEVVEIARQYRFINVHVLPGWVATLSEMLSDEPDIYVGAPVGFPSGGHRTDTKLFEASALIADGVREMDIVMNVGRFKNREYDFVLSELKQVIALKTPDILTKVIIELNCLSDEQLETACEIVVASGADFLKTGTGWVPGDANIERIRRIKKILGGRCKVKAAGGIRTREEFLTLCDMGVERFGINTVSALEIVKSFE